MGSAKGKPERTPFKMRTDGRWLILAGTTLAVCLLCRIPLFFLPAGENLRLIIGFAVYLVLFLYAIVYGMFAYRMTGKVLLPALMLTGFAALTLFSDFSGTLDQIQSVTRPQSQSMALLLYFGKSLRFGVIAAVVGGVIKNLRE